MTKREFRKLANLAGEKKVLYAGFECAVWSVDTIFLELDLILPLTKGILRGINYKKCKI